MRKLVGGCDAPESWFWTAGICCDSARVVWQLLGEQCVFVELKTPKKLKREGRELVRNRTLMCGRLTIKKRVGHAWSSWLRAEDCLLQAGTGLLLARFVCIVSNSVDYRGFGIMVMLLSFLWSKANRVLGKNKGTVRGYLAVFERANSNVSQGKWHWSAFQFNKNIVLCENKNAVWPVTYPLATRMERKSTHTV